jgi:hypothetical protein
MDGAWRTNRWLMLAMGMAAQTATCVCLFGVPFLVPRLQTETGLSSAGATRPTALASAS